MVSYVTTLRVVRIEAEDYGAAKEAVKVAIESGQPPPKDSIDRIVEYRRQLREDRDWAAADEIRAWLASLGVMVDDTAQGARWRVKATTT